MVRSIFTAPILFFLLNLLFFDNQGFGQAVVPNYISRGDTGCPDQSCIWFLGDGFGDKPAVHLRSGQRTWIIPFSKISYTRNEYTEDGISFKIPTSDLLFIFDETGLEVSVLNNQTKVFSNSITIRRTLPAFRTPNTGFVIPFEAGGTNYAVTKYEVTGSFTNIETLIGNYHLDPAKYRNLLHQMYLGGQGKLSLVLWYTGAVLPDCKGGLILEIRNGGFCQQYLDNIKEIVREVRGIGYNEVSIRFASHGSINPSIWSALNKDETLRVSSAIQGVRNVVQPEVTGHQNFRVLYDLCLECGGISTGQTRQFALALYEHYLAQNGNSDTYGASIAYYPGRLKEYLDWLSVAGLPVPTEIGVDIYAKDGEDGDFLRIQDELWRAGIPAKSVTILEAYYNNPQFSQAIFRARNLMRLNIRTVYQWQLQSTISANFDVIEPINFQPYVNLFSPISILSANHNSIHGVDVIILTMNPRNDYAAVEVATGDGLREWVTAVECLPYPSGHPKKSSCYFELPRDPRVLTIADVRVVDMKGAKSDWFLIR